MSAEPRIDTFRALLLLVYVVLIGAGAWLVARRTMAIDSEFLRTRWDDKPIPMVDMEKLTYVAARTIPANHRLSVDDLRRPDIPNSIDVELPRKLIGRYARHVIPAGRAVYEKDVAERPAVAHAPGTALLTFSIEASLVDSGGIDVGTRVEVWNGETRAAAGTVKAVTGSGSTQRIVVAVAGDTVQNIVKRPKDAVQTVLPLR